VAAPPFWQAQLGMHATDPVDNEDDLGRILVDIGDNLLDDGAYDALLEPRICRRSILDGLEIGRQSGE
jgi:hypothetical protein